MKKQTILFLLFAGCSIPAFAAKPGGNEPTAPELTHGFIGYSDALVGNYQTDSGWLGLLNACRDTFGPDARMATTVEVRADPDAAHIASPTPERYRAWVQGVPKFSLDNVFLLETGEWYTTSGAPVVRVDNLSFLNGLNSELRPVACSALR